MLLCDKGNGFLQNQVIGIGDQFPVKGSKVQMEGFNIFNNRLYGQVFIVYLDPAANLIRKGKEQDDPGGDIAQDRPDGKHGHSNNGKNRRKYQGEILCTISPGEHKKEDGDDGNKNVNVLEHQPDAGHMNLTLLPNAVCRFFQDALNDQQHHDYYDSIYDLVLVVQEEGFHFVEDLSKDTIL